MSHQPHSSISTSKNGAGSILEATSPSRASSATSGWATDEDATQYTMAELGLSSRARNCGECPLCLLLAEEDVVSTLLTGEFIYISSIEGMEQAMMLKRKKLCDFYRCILERLKTVPARIETEWAGGKRNRLLTPILNSKTGVENDPFTKEQTNYYYGPICACMIVHRGDDINSHSGLRTLKFTIRHPQADMIAADPRKSTQYNVKFSDLTIDIFALPDDPAADFVATRPPNPILNSDVTFKVARTWLEECELLHTSCKAAINMRGPLGPARLLDLNTSRNYVKLVQLNVSVHVRYATFAHGKSLKKEFFTTSRTLKSSLQNIKISKLPRSVQEAIIITRRLEIPFLWIDSLCIVHDSQKDKDLETSKLPQIITNAVVSIAAANNDDASRSFLRPCLLTEERLQTAIRMPAYCPDGRSGSIYVTMRPQVAFEKEPLIKKAWSLQEMWLAPRMLIYSSNQLQWQCLTASLADGGNETCSEFHERRLEVLRAGKSMKPSLECRDYYIRLWENLIYDYTNKMLAEEEDKLPGIAGMAADFHNIFHLFDRNDQYTAGLWTSSMPILLMWHQLGATSELFPKKSTIYRAPTWSWASVNGTVCPGGSIIRAKGQLPSIEVLKVTVERQQGNTYGMVSSAELQLRANLVTMTKAEVNNRFNICSQQYLPSAGWTVDMILPDGGDDNLDFAHATNGTKQSKGIWGYVKTSAPKAMDLSGQRTATRPMYWFMEIWSATKSSGPCGLVLQRVERDTYRRTGTFILPTTTRRIEFSTGLWENQWEIEWKSEIISII